MSTVQLSLVHVFQLRRSLPILAKERDHSKNFLVPLDLGLGVITFQVDRNE